MYILILLILIIILNFLPVNKEDFKDICKSKLTNREYLEHMIPHHQVAIDMSKILLKNTDNDKMIWLAYRIIKDQQQEVIILDNLKKSKYKYKSNLIL